MIFDQGGHDAGREPIFNVPAGVLGLLIVFCAVMGVRFFLNEADDAELVLSLAFIPARFAGLAAELPGGVMAAWTSFVTHLFVHGDVAHLMFNGASLLAFGGAIEKRAGAVRTLAFFLFCGVLGALTFLAMNEGLLAPMIGASGAIAGLMGGVMRFFFSAMDDGGIRQLNQDPKSVRLTPLVAALQDPRLQVATLAFILMNLAAKFGLGDVAGGSVIAWETHIGGYLAGLLFFGWFDVAPRHRAFGEPRSD